MQVIGVLFNVILITVLWRNLTKLHYVKFSSTLVSRRTLYNYSKKLLWEVDKKTGIIVQRRLFLCNVRVNKSFFSLKRISWYLHWQCLVRIEWNVGDIRIKIK